MINIDYFIKNPPLSYFAFPPPAPLPISFLLTSRNLKFADLRPSFTLFQQSVSPC